MIDIEEDNFSKAMKFIKYCISRLSGAKVKLEYCLALVGKIEQQQAEIERLKKENDSLKKGIKEFSDLQQSLTDLGNGTLPKPPEQK